jgi:hypothetical protein
MFNVISYAFFVMFVGLFLRDWVFLSDIRSSPAYKLVSEPKEADEKTGEVVPLAGKKLEEYRQKHDFLGTILRIAEHNFTTSGIALLLSAAVALISTFIGPL